MTNLAILPIIIPLFAAIILAFTTKKVKLSRTLAKIFTIINLAFIGYITYEVFTKGSIILETGSWKAPFGIIFVADIFSIVIVLTSSILTTAIIFFATRTVSENKEKHYFYALVFFLISGVSGAFLTGDLFNLFVFFEVLLMASYGLIVLGGEKKQLRESFKYLLFNLFSSVIFVTTVAFLYAVVGTVNMAHIAERVQEINQQGIFTTIGIVLFFVFESMAAFFPIYFWMPKSYTVPNPIVSSLFGALLTNVVIYAILRVYTLIFVGKQDITGPFFITIAMLTMIFGVIGALSTNDIKLLVAYNVIPSIGFVLLGIGLFNESGLSGSVYYLLHDMIVKATLFLIVGVVVYVAGTANLNKMQGLIHHYPALGWMVFLSAFVLAGIPPFSGFIGKLLLLRGAAENGEILVIIISLLMSLLILYSVMKIFIRGFWGEKDTAHKRKSLKGMIGPVSFLLAISIFLGVGAEFVYPYINDVGNYLLDPDQYIYTVLKE